MTAIQDICKKAKASLPTLQCLATDIKNQAITAMAKDLVKEQKAIIKANEKDLKAAQDQNLNEALVDRLKLNEARIKQMAQALEEIAALEDPIGKIIETRTRPNGLEVRKVRIPIGVIGFIYESRPNVTSDAAALCLKSGNAVILRGGSEAFHSNQAVIQTITTPLKNLGIPHGAIQTFPTKDRNAIKEMLHLEDEIDLVIPRGGEALIRFVNEEARMPVLKHFKGNCHLYLDETLDEDMAINIALNAKTQRPGVCNAIETLLVHEKHQKNLLPKLLKALNEHGVELRLHQRLCKLFPEFKEAKEEDWYEEYLDLILAVKSVKNVDEAIAHIQTYGSNHTEAIVTQNETHAARFLKSVASSVVLVNASTRFADGGELGMGAEIGISTTKLHAFGPMGLEDLTIGHYEINGNGQVR